MKRNIGAIISTVIMVLLAVLLLWACLMYDKLIWESDLPTWFKIFLLK